MKEKSSTVNFFNIFSYNLLKALSEKLPTCQNDLLKVEGMTFNKVRQYNAERFLEITTKYAALIECKFLFWQCNIVSFKTNYCIDC